MAKYMWEKLWHGYWATLAGLLAFAMTWSLGIAVSFAIARLSASSEDYSERVAAGAGEAGVLGMIFGAGIFVSVVPAMVCGIIVADYILRRFSGEGKVSDPGPSSTVIATGHGPRTTDE